VKSLVAAVEDLGNPFLEESGGLFVLDKVIADESRQYLGCARSNPQEKGSEHSFLSVSSRGKSH